MITFAADNAYIAQSKNSEDMNVVPTGASKVPFTAD